MSLNPNLFNNRGSLLLEALLATIILSVSLTVIVQSFLNGLRALRYSSGYTQAHFFLENKMNNFIQKGFIQGPFNLSVLHPHGPYKYKLEERNGGELTPEAQLKEIKLTIFWPVGNKDNSLALSTYVLALKKKGESL